MHFSRSLTVTNLSDLYALRSTSISLIDLILFSSGKVIVKSTKFAVSLTKFSSVQYLAPGFYCD